MIASAVNNRPLMRDIQPHHLVGTPREQTVHRSAAATGLLDVREADYPTDALDARGPIREIGDAAERFRVNYIVASDHDPDNLVGFEYLLESLIMSRLPQTLDDKVADGGFDAQPRQRPAESKGCGRKDKQYPPRAVYDQGQSLLEG